LNNDAACNQKQYEKLPEATGPFFSGVFSMVLYFHVGGLWVCNKAGVHRGIAGSKR
jgi:hypothetical protein